MMNGQRPAVWLSDRCAAQPGHADAQQTCLAHPAREVAHAVESSDDPVPWRLQLWLDAVPALAGRVTGLAATTRAAKGRALERQLASILTTASTCELTRELQGKGCRARSAVPATSSGPFWPTPARTNQPTTPANGRCARR